MSSPELKNRFLVSFHMAISYVDVGALTKRDDLRVL